MHILKPYYKPWPFWTGLIAIIILLISAKTLYRWTTADGKQATPTTVSVQTVKVATQGKEIPSVIETIGTLTGQKEVKIKSPGVARVGRILVEGGKYVRAGTELILLLGGVEVRAPFDGYISDWLVKSGDLVASGTELVEIINTDIISLTYRVPEQYASQVDFDQEVQIKVRSFPELPFKGKVKFISPMVDKKTYTILVRAEIENLDQNLWPGMSAHVTHILNSRPDTLIIPESALILTMDGYEAMVVEGGKLTRRKVKVGSRSLGRAQIFSGINPGESVLLTRTDATVEGAAVTAVDWQGEW